MNLDHLLLLVEVVEAGDPVEAVVVVEAVDDGGEVFVIAGGDGSGSCLGQ